MKKSLFIFAAACCFLLASCGEESAKSAVYSDVMVTEAAIMTDSGVRLSKQSVMAEEALPEPESFEAERKLIKTGSVNIEVDNFDSIENSVFTFARNYGGYITNTWMSDTNYSAEIKIPCDKFDQAMNHADSLGKVKSRSQNANDVTDQYYDLESRINSKKILRDKLEGYLKKASSIEELMSIERELNSVISDLESMEGRMKRLSNQIDYSTIILNIYLPAGYVDTGFDWPDIGEDFKEIGYNIVNFLSGFLIFIIYLVLYGIPILALFAFLFWLLFGKVGLLRKLFSKLKK